MGLLQLFKGKTLVKRTWSVPSVINMTIKGCYVHNKQCSPPKSIK